MGFWAAGALQRLREQGVALGKWTRRFLAILFQTFWRLLTTFLQALRPWLNFLGVLGTWALAGLAYCALQDNKAGLESAQRAWISPRFAKFDEIPPKVGQQIKITVEIENPGKAPGLGTAKFGHFKFLTDPELQKSAPDRIFADDEAECMALLPVTGQMVLYSTNSKFYVLHWPASGEPVYTFNDKMISGDKIVFFIDCLSYETFNKPHHSLYCYYYQKGLVDPSNLSYCGAANKAD